eukprot:g1871.t1
MDVQDAFRKLREQILICYEAARGFNMNNTKDLTPLEMSRAKGGLTMINSTNLEWFSSSQKSELFRMKGLFLALQKKKEQANKEFSNALQIDNGNSKAWLSWGRYLDQVYKESPERDINIAAQAVCCYLQAVNHKTEGARLSLARVLWLMSNDDEKGTICETFQRYGDRMPLWIWVVWIPQLLTSLMRPEATKIRSILLHLATVYPQALYYTLRAFLLEKREIPPDEVKGKDNLASSGKEKDEAASGEKDEKKKNEESKPMPTDIAEKMNENRSKARGKSSSKNGDKRLNSVKYAEELVAYLRRAHPALASEIERMLEELIVRFKPAPEEELESAVQALLSKCFQLNHSADTKSVPVSLRTTLTRVCRKFFADATSRKSETHKRFVLTYKGPFQRDLLPVLNKKGEKEVKNLEFPTTLEGVIWNLRVWKRFLRRRVRLLPPTLRMHSCSRYLDEYCSHLIEVPGQYTEDLQEPKAKLHTKLFRFSQTVQVLHRHGFCQRRIGIIGSDGKERCFLVQFAIPHITRTDERMVQFRVILNRLLNKHAETRRRQLSYHINTVIPVTPRVRLVMDDRSHICLESIFSKYMKGDADDVIIKFRKLQQQYAEKSIEDGIVETSDEELKRKLRAFRAVCKMVPANILQKFMIRNSKSKDALFTKRTAMAKQLGLINFLCTTLSVGERVPHRIGLLTETGQLCTAEFRPTYNHNGLLENGESVPFRLTRNLQVALGDFSIGMVATTMASTALALQKRRELMQDYLALFMRDDLLSWHASKTAPRSESKERQMENTLRERVARNVGRALSSLKRLAPRYSPPQRQDIINDTVNASVNAVRQARRSLKRKQVDGAELFHSSCPGAVGGLSGGAYGAASTVAAQRAIDRTIFGLIACASSEENLCQMSPTWQAWI